MEIGKRIKNARLAAGLTQAELGRRLGIGKEAVYKYETGVVTNIPGDKLIAMARIFGVTTDYLLGVSDDPLNGYGLTLEPECADTPVTRIYNRLNADGQREYVRYGNYLCSCDEYRATEPAPVTYIRHYFTAAAAGYAAPIEGEDFELVPADEKTPANADFCIDIAGDSMEPYIHDGQRVYVTRDITNLQEFDVGIFFVDGDVFCKQWCVDYIGSLHLLSANENREDANLRIGKDSAHNVVCFGKVILPRRLPRPTYR